MNESISKWLSVVALLCAILLFAWNGVRLGWTAFSPPPEALAFSAPTVTDPQQYSRPLVGQLVGKINGAQLFGRTADALPASDREVPVSAIDLQLAAVFATGNEEGLALVADGNGKEQLYGIGAALPGGVELLEVLDDAIVIDVNGEQQKLLLREPAGVKGRAAQGTLPPQRNRTFSLARFRDQLVNDPSRLTSEVGIRPVVRDGTQLGYRLTPRGRGVELFRAIGLQAGDVVTSINGVSLESPSAALDVLGSIADVNSLELDIVRRGRTLHLRKSMY